MVTPPDREPGPTPEGEGGDPAPTGSPSGPVASPAEGKGPAAAEGAREEGARESEKAAVEREVVADEPLATRSEVRGLRLWLVVAGVWAVAASAIALLALFTDDPPGDEQRNFAAAEDVSRLSNRVDRLEGRLGPVSDRQDELSSDISGLLNRVDRLEQSVPDARAQTRENTDMLSSLREQLAELEDRVAEAEAEAQSSGGGGRQRSP